MGFRSALGVVALAAGLAVPAVAQAAGARVRLEYARGEGAASCPDARAFAGAVAGRLGYEPFDSAAAGRVMVTIDRRAAAFEARIEMVGARGAPTAERRFSSQATDCAELAATVELALAIAIDPFHASAANPPAPAAAPPPVPADATAPSDRLATVVQVPAPAPVRRPVVVEIAAALVGAVGVAPAAGWGLEARIGARRGELSLALEGRADFPASEALSTGDVSAYLLVASLVPCAHWRQLAACALASAGVLRAAGHGLPDAQQVSDPWVSLGARLEGRVPLRGPLLLTAHVDAVAPLVQTELKVGDAVVWTTPAVAFAAALGLAVIFP